MVVSHSIRWVASYAYGAHGARYAIVFASDGATAARHASALGIAAGATGVAVAVETDTHNIPALDPVAWAAAVEAHAAQGRRIRDEALPRRHAT